MGKYDLSAVTQEKLNRIEEFLRSILSLIDRWPLPSFSGGAFPLDHANSAYG